MAAAKAAGVLKPDGMLLWYDFVIKPTNPDTHRIGSRSCESSFRGSTWTPSTSSRPPRARTSAQFSWRLPAVLQELRPLQTHLLAFLTRSHA